MIITVKHNVNKLQIIYEVGIFIIMYIFILTEVIIRACFNVGLNMLVCVVSRYNYSIVYYLLVFSHYLKLNVTLFTINIQHNIV